MKIEENPNRPCAGPAQGRFIGADAANRPCVSLFRPANRPCAGQHKVDWDFGLFQLAIRIAMIPAVDEQYLAALRTPLAPTRRCFIYKRIIPIFYGFEQHLKHIQETGSPRGNYGCKMVGIMLVRTLPSAPGCLFR